MEASDYGSQNSQPNREGSVKADNSEVKHRTISDDRWYLVCCLSVDHSYSSGE
ncbi:unnamed protein product [Amaranthus hypochondriacus]